MSGRAARRAGALLLAAVLLAGAPAAGGEDPAPPLTDEDVVRMMAAGRSDAEIVGAIESRDVRFDLSDEMVDEMRAAGVSPRVVDAMRARQAQLHPPDPPPRAAPAPADTLPTARVTFVAVKEKETALYLPTVLPNGIAKAMQLPASPKERTIAGLAVFVVCATADHVPDQWRTRSPMGRDFLTMPRHEMLAFQPSATRVAAKDAPRASRLLSGDADPGVEPEWLRLDVPQELAIPLRPGVTHDLVAGLAVLVGENYIAIALSDREEVPPDSMKEGVRVSVGVAARKGSEPSGILEVRFR